MGINAARKRPLEINDGCIFCMLCEDEGIALGPENWQRRSDPLSTWIADQPAR